MATRTNEEEDRVSKLPDHILVKILSCLPTIDSVRTSVLSKRWVPLWTQITSLHFYLEDYCQRLNNPHRDDIEDCFQNFVSMVFSRLVSPTLESFSLSTGDSFSDLPILDTCLPLFENKELRNLFICSDSYNPTIFSCQTLVDLFLEINHSSHIVIPHFVHLPNLRILELHHCFFVSENSSDNIVLSFPVLKKLILIDTHWLDIQSVSFEVPLLEKLGIVQMERRYTIGESCIENINFTSNPLVSICSDLFELLGYYDGEDGRREAGLRACMILQQLNIHKVKQLLLSCTRVFILYMHYIPTVIFDK